MSCIPTPEQAKEILAKYNKEPFHMQHGEIVSGVLGRFAERYEPGSEDYWRAVGMLHDVDFELYPEEHCVKGEALLRQEDIDEGVIRAALSHGYGLTGVAYEPEHIMEKLLFAADDLTGLIGAAALMRPSRSVSDMERSSVMKKFKDKKFAAGCSRETIRQGAEALGWPLERLVDETLEAMKTLEER